MAAYLLRRLLLLVPTLFGIIAINFAVVQFAPGGPVEQMMAELRGHGEGGGMTRMTGSTGGKMKALSDYLINIPSGDTPRIQESHILVGHIICEIVENNLFGE